MIGVPVRAAVVVAVVLATLVGCGRYSFDTVPEPTFPTSSPTTSSKPLERADVVGRWVPDDFPRTAQLDLRRTTARIEDGCIPHGFGSWVVEHGRVKLRDAAPVRLPACPGRTSFLQAAESFALRGDTLVAFDGEGEPLGRLHRPGRA